MMDVEQPDWRERLLEKVEVSQRKGTNHRKARRSAQVQVFFDPPFMHAIKEAARARDISVGPYVRRAIAKQVAKDLGIEWEILLEHCAAPSPYGSKPPGARAGTFGVPRSFDDGEGYGDWSN